jgi:hypothetical protein
VKIGDAVVIFQTSWPTNKRHPTFSIGEGEVISLDEETIVVRRDRLFGDRVEVLDKNFVFPTLDVLLKALPHKTK